MEREGSVPLRDALLAYNSRRYLRLHVPGHKGRSLDDMEFMGREVFELDVTELPGLDDLHEPSGPIREAQRLLAEAYGADESFFLVNGTTGGLHAALMAICRPGDKVILPRNVHRAVIGGLILSGTDPVYLRPEVSRVLGVASIISPEELRRGLTTFPEARCVVMINPDYLGVAGDVETLVGMAHRAGMSVIADEAHGAHFSFHPHLPPSAVKVGADITVQSAHKLLGSLTQTSFLHLKRGMVCAERLRSALRILQTTSPSYPLMVSLDVVRRRMVIRGEELLQALLDLAEEIRREINRIEGFRCFDAEDLDLKGKFALDPTKLVISGVELNISGYELARTLREIHGIQVEFADLNNALAILTIADIGGEEVRRLIRVLQQISLERNQARGRATHRDLPLFEVELPAFPEKILTPREAFFAPHEWVDLEDAKGRISWDVVAPYPPGVPLLCPGEQVTSEVIEYLRYLKGAGARFHGLKDDRFMAVLR